MKIHNEFSNHVKFHTYKINSCFLKVPVAQKKEQQIFQRQSLHVAAGREEVN